jgi:hypothetical protein
MKVEQTTKVENKMVPVTRTVVVMEAQAVKQRIFNLELREAQIKAFYAMCNNVHVILDGIDESENVQMKLYRNSIKDLLGEGFDALYGEYKRYGHNSMSSRATGEVIIHD